MVKCSAPVIERVAIADGIVNTYDGVTAWKLGMECDREEA